MKKVITVPRNFEIVLTKYKIAIFCDGEFFHRKDSEVLKPRLEKSNNSEFWISKISRNRERDDELTGDYCLKDGLLSGFGVMI